jgi:hypothetical protein
VDCVFGRKRAVIQRIRDQSTGSKNMAFQARAEQATAEADRIREVSGGGGAVNPRLLSRITDSLTRIDSAK